MSKERKWIIREDSEYKIVGKQERGCDPYFILYTRASFFGLFSWWGFECWASSVEALSRHIERCKAWDSWEK